MERGRGVRHVPAPERREGLVEREELGRRGREREYEREERLETIAREESPRVRGERIGRLAGTDEHEREYEERPEMIVREESPRVRVQRIGRPTETNENDIWYNNPEPRERRQQPHDSRDTYPSFSRHVIRENADGGVRDFDGPAGSERQRLSERSPVNDATPVYLMDRMGDRYVFPLSMCGSKEVCVALGLAMSPEY